MFFSGSDSGEISNNSSKHSRNSHQATIAGPSTTDSLDLETATLRVEEDPSGSKSFEKPPDSTREATTWHSPELEANPALRRDVNEEKDDPYLVKFDKNDPLNPKVGLPSCGLSSHRDTDTISSVGQRHIVGTCSYFIALFEISY